jgi:hypothetical protein
MLKLCLLIPATVLLELPQPLGGKYSCRKNIIILSSNDIHTTAEIFLVKAHFFCKHQYVTPGAIY